MTILILRLIFMVAAIWPALRAKPLGSQPYRWGTYVAITVVWPTFWLIVSSVDEVMAGRPGGALALSLVAGAYAAASIGLLRRRKFGALALCMACMASLMLIPFFDSVPNQPFHLAARAAPVFSTAVFIHSSAPIPADAWFLCTFVYFWKRWSLMSVDKSRGQWHSSPAPTS